jgi:hypothetical protein
MTGIALGLNHRRIMEWLEAYPEQIRQWALMRPANRRRVFFRARRSDLQDLRELIDKAAAELWKAEDGI